MATYQDVRAGLGRLFYRGPVLPGRYGCEIQQGQRDAVGVQIDQPAVDRARFAGSR
jgi:hypothetical protein